MKLAFFATLLLVAPNMILAQDETAEDAKPQKQQAEVIAEAVDEEIAADGNRGPEGVDIAVMAIGNDMSQMVAAKRFQLNQIFAVEIDEIKRVCDLNDGQVTKLNVGAKGAIKRLMDEWGKTAGRRFGGMAVAQVDIEANEDEQNDNGQPAATVAEVEITDADQLDERTMRAVATDDIGNPLDFVQPTNSEFWKKALSSTLSESQTVQLDQYRQEQDKKKRSAMIGLCLSTMNLELGLNDEQHAILSALVTPLMEKAEFECPWFYEQFLFYYHASKVDEKVLREFLSSAQLQKWKLFMAPAKEIAQEVLKQPLGAVQVEEVDGEPIEIDDDQ